MCVSETMHCVSKSDNVSSRGEIGLKCKKLPISLTTTNGGGEGMHYSFVAFKSLCTGKEGQNINILLFYCLRGGWGILVLAPHR